MPVTWPHALGETWPHHPCERQRSARPLPSSTRTICSPRSSATCTGSRRTVPEADLSVRSLRKRYSHRWNVAFSTPRRAANSAWVLPEVSSNSSMTFVKNSRPARFLMAVPYSATLNLDSTSRTGRLRRNSRGSPQAKALASRVHACPQHPSNRGHVFARLSSQCPKAVLSWISILRPGTVSRASTDGSAFRVQRRSRVTS